MPAGDATNITDLRGPGGPGYFGPGRSIGLGEDGLSILHGVGPPDPLLGRLGEFYVESSPAGLVIAIYGPKAEPGWGQATPMSASITPGPEGPPGPQGPAGGRRFYGVGPPPVLIVGSTLGDEYLDIASGDLYNLE